MLGLTYLHSGTRKLNLTFYRFMIMFKGAPKNQNMVGIITTEKNNKNHYPKKIRITTRKNKNHYPKIDI